MEESGILINRRHFSLITLGLIVSAGATPPKAPKLTLLVPAYFYPSGQGLRDWNRMIASASIAPITAIVNPASGPGKAIDTNFVAVLKRAGQAKLALVGYVSTHYTEHALEDAKADIDRWLQFYPQIGGFFFDEQASDVTKIGYYTKLAAHARAALAGARLISNPGTVCAEPYVARSTSEVVCLFENSQGFDAYQPPPWAANYGPERFAVIPYAIPRIEGMRRVLRAAVSQRTGVIYVTDASGVNPYDRLPSYWDDEVQAVAAINAR